MPPAYGSLSPALAPPRPLAPSPPRCGREHGTSPSARVVGAKIPCARRDVVLSTRREGEGKGGLEEAGDAGLDALHVLIVEHDAANAAVLGEHARLRLDLLRGEHAGDGREVRVAAQQL